MSRYQHAYMRSSLYLGLVCWAIAALAILTAPDATPQTVHLHEVPPVVVAP